MIWCSSNWGDVVLAQDLEEEIYGFYLIIFIADLGLWILITDECFHNPPLTRADLYKNSTETPKEGLISI